MAIKKKVSRGRPVKKKAETKKRGRPAKKVEAKKETKKRGRPAKSEPTEKVVAKRGRPKKIKETSSNLSSKYTEAELEKAKSYVSDCDSRVTRTIKTALISTPKESWNPTTTIVINNRTDVLNTHALAKVLMD